MANVYTPGLKVTARTVVKKTRRLPIFGQVLVKVGQRVGATDIVARTDLPGKVYPANIANALGVMPDEVPTAMMKKPSDAITKGEVIAETKGMFGFFKGQYQAPIDGTVDNISHITGQVMLRENPIPVTVQAYVDGTVAEILEREGVVVQTVATFVQGIFGLSGEAHGPLRRIAERPDAIVAESAIDESCRGKVLIAGSFAPLSLLKKAIAVGARGLVVGGFDYNDIKELLGKDLGVAITGGEKLGTTLVVTEGFGRIAMAQRTFDLLAQNEGRIASINGATQIRAGVIRPEIIVPLEGVSAEGHHEAPLVGLEVGAPVRCIRFPYFGKLGRVTALPSELAKMESETMVRVMEVTFDEGGKAIVPRANVEAIEG